MKITSTTKDAFLDDTGERAIFFPDGRLRIGRQKAYVLPPEVDATRLLAPAQALQNWGIMYILLIPPILIWSISTLRTAFPERGNFVAFGSLVITSTPIYLLRFWYFRRIRKQLKNTRPVRITIGISELVVPGKSVWMTATIVVLVIILEIIIFVVSGAV